MECIFPGFGISYSIKFMLTNFINMKFKVIAYLKGYTNAIWNYIYKYI